MNNFEQNNNDYNNNQINNMNQYPNNGQYNNMNQYPNNGQHNNMNNGYNNNQNDRKPLSHYIKKFLIAFLFAAIIIFILLWLFPTKSALNPFYDKIFKENIDTMKEVATAYYTTDRLPKKVGDTEKLTLGEMLEMKLLLDVKDKNGETCDIDDSYVELTKEDKEYKMKVNLKCGSEEDYIIVYLGCYNYCLNDICQKKEKTIATVVSNAAQTVVKKVEKVTKTEIIKPKPVKKVYKYLYQKIVKIHHDKEYSKWSEWSDDIEYNPDNNNINWGKHEYSWYEKNGSKTVKTTKLVVDTSKEINQTQKVLMGTYSTWACDGYDYFYDQNTSTTYTVTSGWSYVGTITTSSIPSWSNNVRYEWVGFDFTNCGNVCNSSHNYTFKKYVRSTSTTSKTSTSEENLRAVCTNVIKKDIPVYATVTEFVAFDKKQVTEINTVYYYHKKTRVLTKQAYDEKKTYKAWSYSKSDKTLIKQGYKYTGVYKRIK